MFKTCRICNQIKEVIFFEKNRKVCKSCRQKQIYDSFKSNPIRVEKKRERSRIWSSLRNKKLDKEYLRKKSKKYREKHKEDINRKSRLYQKEYRQREYVKIKNAKRMVQYNKEKRQNDTGYRIRLNISRRIRALLKQQGLIKDNKTLYFIGCSIEFLKEHLQQTAIKNGYLDFDINNYSGKDYHIDHIIPCSAFNLQCKFHQRICFHWSNLQILTSKENLKKQNFY